MDINLEDKSRIDNFTENFIEQYKRYYRRPKHPRYNLVLDGSDGDVLPAQPLGSDNLKFPHKTYIPFFLHTMTACDWRGRQWMIQETVLAEGWRCM